MAIKQVGIKNSSGVYEYTDIGAEASNVEMASGTDLETKIGNMDTDIAGKVDQESGKGLSTEDYTTAEKNKLSGIETGAQVNTVTSVNSKTGAVTLDYGDVGAAPTSHATSALTYGGGTASNYGHVKLSDAYTGSGSAASASVGASAKAVTDMYANVAPDKNTVGAHNAIYRGEELLSSSHFGTGSTGLAALKTAVSNGDFSDIYVGDTITVTMAAVSGYESASQTVVWVVMGINIYYNNGDTALTSNHLVLVPKDAFKTAQRMNSSNTTANGYAGSEMFATILPAYKTAINNCLGGNIITYRNWLSTAMDTTKTSRAYSGYTGAASNAAWTNVTISLCSESEVYGHAALSSSRYDIGIDCMQLPGFSLNPTLKIKGLGNGGSRYSWWLSAVVDSANFAYVRGYGDATNGGASHACGVVPKVLFG